MPHVFSNSTSLIALADRLSRDESEEAYQETIVDS